MPTTHHNLTGRVQKSLGHIEEKQKEVDAYMDSLQKFELEQEQPQRDTQVESMNGIIRLSIREVEEIAKKVDDFIKQKKNSSATQSYLEMIDKQLDVIEHRISAINIPKSKH